MGNGYFLYSRYSPVSYIILGNHISYNKYISEFSLSITQFVSKEREVLKECFERIRLMLIYILFG